MQQKRQAANKTLKREWVANMKTNWKNIVALLVVVGGTGTGIFALGRSLNTDSATTTQNVDVSMASMDSQSGTCEKCASGDHSACTDGDCPEHEPAMSMAMTTTTNQENMMVSENSMENMLTSKKPVEASMASATASEGLMVPAMADNAMAPQMAGNAMTPSMAAPSMAREQPAMAAPKM